MRSNAVRDDVFKLAVRVTLERFAQSMRMI